MSIIRFIRPKFTFFLIFLSQIIPTHSQMFKTEDLSIQAMHPHPSILRSSSSGSRGSSGLSLLPSNLSSTSGGSGGSGDSPITTLKTHSEDKSPSDGEAHTGRSDSSPLFVSTGMGMLPVGSATLVGIRLQNNTVEMTTSDYDRFNKRIQSVEHMIQATSISAEKYPSTEYTRLIEVHYIHYTHYKNDTHDSHYTHYTHDSHYTHYTTLYALYRPRSWLSS